MQKFKHTASKYAVVSALALFIMIFLWFFFNWSYVNFKGDILFNYSNKDKLTEFFTDNFYGTRACCLVFPLPFAFAINYLLYDEKVFYICRMKNRMQYITQCILNIIAFSFICAFFHEAVSIICSYRIFGGELINELHIIKYCSLNFITIFLYFVRVGGVFLLIRLFTKAVGLFLMIIIIFQALYFLNDESLHLYSFAVGINRESKDAMDIITMAVFLVPVFFMHFYFSETLYNLTHGYGKLYIIRQYSKTKLIIKQIVKIFLSVLVITAFQIITSFIFSASLKSVQAGNMIRCVSIYIICIFTMQMLQMMLEYFLKPEQAAIICCAYALVSYSVGYFLADSIIVRVLFFPCLMFGAVNGALTSETYYIKSFAVLLLICLCLIVGNIYKFKKTDIF